MCRDWRSDSEVPNDQDARHFTFDRVYSSEMRHAEAYADQADLYESVGAPLVASCFAGYNNTIFAYGHTGSGKTYTTSGSAPGRGRKKCKNLSFRWFRV